MLIRFRVANFLSIKDEVELSMVKGASRHHPEHVTKIGNGRQAINLLRTSIIYGANASGKSNLIKAAAFARSLVIKGTKAQQSIRVNPFKLDELSRTKPTKMEFEIKTESSNFIYGFETTSEKILSEWLYELKIASNTLLYERKTMDNGDVNVEFSEDVAKTKDEGFIRFIARGTRPNQLFLKECAEKNFSLFMPVYNWFSRSLVIIFPYTRFKISDTTEGDIGMLAKFLATFDTGICDIQFREVPNVDWLPDVVHKQISDDIAAEEVRDKKIAFTGDRGERLIISVNSEGSQTLHEMVFSHKSLECQDTVLFNASEESDGSLRLIDLVPILSLGVKRDKVFFIDELDRSLHPRACYDLISRFLTNGSTHTQLIATTHESNLLDTKLLRRDEIWFIEKNQEGASSVYSLEEFAPRYDKDIRKGYLLGRFGAIPILGKKAFQ